MTTKKSVQIRAIITTVAVRRQAEKRLAIHPSLATISHRLFLFYHVFYFYNLNLNQICCLFLNMFFFIILNFRCFLFSLLFFVFFVFFFVLWWLQNLCKLLANLLKPSKTTTTKKEFKFNTQSKVLKFISYFFLLF